MIITIHGGVNEIGGNKIILKDKDAKILLDFGMSYKERRRFYSEPWLIPKDEQDLLEFGILPQINGIYKFDNNERLIDAFFLSHAHTDHYKCASFLKREIDMYCGKGTKVLLDIFNTIRHKSFEHDLSDIKWNTFVTGDVIKINSLSIEPIHVDHSIPASYAFIIHTSNGSIAYTGDLRTHGGRNDLTTDFIEKARSCDLEAIICEGTNIMKGEIVSEDEVFKKSKDLISFVKGLVVVGFSIADIDRLRTFYNASLANNRIMTITPKQAYLLSLLKEHDLRIDLPDKDNIAVYKKRKKRYDKYEYKAFDEYTTVDADEIKNKQSRYLLVLQPHDLTELIDIKPIAGSCYIYSSSEPFNEESEIEFDRFINWLDHFALPMYHIHASGHIMPMALRSMLEEIKAKRVIPIHTEHQMMFAKLCKDVSNFVIPVRDECINIMEI